MGAFHSAKQIAPDSSRVSDSINPEVLDTTRPWSKTENRADEKRKTAEIHWSDNNMDPLSVQSAKHVPPDSSHVPQSIIHRGLDSTRQSITENNIDDKRKTVEITIGSPTENVFQRESKSGRSIAVEGLTRKKSSKSSSGSRKSRLSVMDEDYIVLRDMDLPLPKQKSKSMDRYPVDDEELYHNEDYSLSSMVSNLLEDELAEEDELEKRRNAKRGKKYDEPFPDEEEENNIPEIEQDIFHSEDDRDPFYAPYGFIIMCSLQIIWGSVGVFLIFLLRYIKATSMRYIVLDKEFSDHSIYYWLLGASLTIFSGICGIVSLLLEIPFMLYIIPHLMWMIVTLCVSSSVTASGNSMEPTKATYYRLFEAAYLYPTDPSVLTLLWPELNGQIWNDIQTSMRCCGVEKAIDWFHLPVPSMPSSCCLEDNKTCGPALHKWMIGKSGSQMIQHFSDIEKMVFDDSCIKVIEIERRNHTRDWITYPLIFLSFHFIIMFNFNYLTRLLINEYRSWEGLARLELFKSQNTNLFRSRIIAWLWALVPFRTCATKKKELSKRDLEKKIEASKESLFASVTDAVDMHHYTHSLKTPLKYYTYDRHGHGHRHHKWTTQKSKTKVDPVWVRRKNDEMIKHKMGITNKSYVMENRPTFEPPSHKEFSHRAKEMDFKSVRGSFGTYDKKMKEKALNEQPLNSPIGRMPLKPQLIKSKNTWTKQPVKTPNNSVPEPVTTRSTYAKKNNTDPDYTPLNPISLPPANNKPKPLNRPSSNYAVMLTSKSKSIAPYDTPLSPIPVQQMPLGNKSITPDHVPLQPQSGISQMPLNPLPITIDVPPKEESIAPVTDSEPKEPSTSLPRKKKTDKYNSESDQPYAGHPNKTWIWKKD